MIAVAVYKVYDLCCTVAINHDIMLNVWYKMNFWLIVFLNIYVGILLWLLCVFIHTYHAIKIPYSGEV